MQVDFIIVGQGICGTLLSRRLILAGFSVVVIDNGSPNAAGRVAGGIINPITGKRLVRTWLAEELLPFAISEYTALQNELNRQIITPCNILDFHLTRDEGEFFHQKMVSETEYLTEGGNEDRWQHYFRFNYGVGLIDQCLLVEINTMLDGWKHQLKKQNSLLEEEFIIADCSVSGHGIIYKDIKAGKIIICNGAAGADNPFFNRLPWSKDKGEALIASIPGLPRDNIYKQGISIVPWKGDLFWIGASHDWKYTVPHPTPAFRARICEQLDYWLKLPYEIVDHIAALRPANFDRKPFIGFHPVHKNVGIFNGMGGKGCSLAPYFAAKYSDFITNGTALPPEVDIMRYERILSR